MFGTPAQAVPLPPPPPAIVDVVSKLLMAVEKRDFAAYSALIGENVTVFRNRDKIAEGKPAWLELERHAFDDARTQVHSIATSYKGAMVAESLDTRVFGKPGNSDCCRWARTVLYGINHAGYINRIDILEDPAADWSQPFK
jgi:ketosteroid isomerase-like protein